LHNKNKLTLIKPNFIKSASNLEAKTPLEKKELTNIEFGSKKGNPETISLFDE